MQIGWYLFNRFYDFLPLSIIIHIPVFNHFSCFSEVSGRNMGRFYIREGEMSGLLTLTRVGAVI